MHFINKLIIKKSLGRHIIILTCYILGIIFARGSDDEERLMIDLFRGYNSLIQPVKNSSDRPLIVRMALQLVLLIDVDEKDQV